MSVTKQTYSLAAGWTSSDLAGIFRSAFIDAGLMTEWYDSFFSSPLENRILEIDYDSGKTYGKTYYWFQFHTTSNRFTVGLATGWNATTHVPVGTQYLDYYSTATASEQGRILQSGLNTGAVISITRFTSQINGTHSWFRVKQGTNYFLFTIARPEHTIAPWIDLDKVSFYHFLTPAFVGGGNAMMMTYNNTGSIRRLYGVGSAHIGDTTRRDMNLISASYSVVGRANGSTASNLGGGVFGGMNNGVSGEGFTLVLPSAASSVNTAYTSNYNPVVTGLPYSFYMTNSAMPADFAVAPHYLNNTLAPEDTFVVTAGVEEYEVLACGNNSTANTTASMAFLARIV
jgi:hypothetical protein